MHISVLWSLTVEWISAVRLARALLIFLTLSWIYREYSLYRLFQTWMENPISSATSEHFIPANVYAIVELNVDDESSHSRFCFLRSFDWIAILSVFKSDQENGMWQNYLQIIMTRSGTVSLKAVQNQLIRTVAIHKRELKTCPKYFRMVS